MADLISLFKKASSEKVLMYRPTRPMLLMTVLLENRVKSRLLLDKGLILLCKNVAYRPKFYEGSLS